MKTVTKLENTFEFEGCLEEGTGKKIGVPFIEADLLGFLHDRGH